MNFSFGDKYQVYFSGPSDLAPLPLCKMFLKKIDFTSMKLKTNENRKKKRGMNKTLLKSEMEVTSFMAWENHIIGQ